MNLAFVSSSVSREAGGLFFSVRSLATALDSLDPCQVSIHGLEDSNTSEDLVVWSHLRPVIHSVQGPRALGWSPGMSKALVSNDYDLLHTQGIWQWPSAAVNHWHRSTGRPYLISPRGMLDPWAVANSRWKKRIAAAWYETAHLRDAACLHALCQSEAESIRAYGLKNPIAVIPNGVDLVDAKTLKTEKLKSEKKILLFLGRLHPKKGLVNALRAWGKIRSQETWVRGQEEWQFVIAGWDQGGHEAELKRLCDELGLTYAETPASEFLKLTPDSCPLTPVVFTGPAFGVTKDALLRSASAFILPSFSEGLPMSVLEAWSYRLPILMTDHCNLPEGFAADAAIRIGTDPESIAEGLHQLLQSTIPDLQSIGRNGRSLVEIEFTWPQVATQMKEVYEWLLGGGPKPCSVILPVAP